MSGELVRLRQDPLEPELAAFTLDDDDDDPLIVVNSTQSRSLAVRAMRALRHRAALVWLPGMQAYAEMARRFFADNTATAACSIAIAGLGGAAWVNTDQPSWTEPSALYQAERRFVSLVPPPLLPLPFQSSVSPPPPVRDRVADEVRPTRVAKTPQPSSTPTSAPSTVPVSATISASAVPPAVHPTRKPSPSQAPRVSVTVQLQAAPEPSVPVSALPDPKPSVPPVLPGPGPSVPGPAGPHIPDVVVSVGPVEVEISLPL